jgi:hypothetical protein
MSLIHSRYRNGTSLRSGSSLLGCGDDSRHSTTCRRTRTNIRRNSRLEGYWSTRVFYRLLCTGTYTSAPTPWALPWITYVSKDNGALKLVDSHHPSKHTRWNTRTSRESMCLALANIYDNDRIPNVGANAFKLKVRRKRLQLYCKTAKYR